ncbi:hypothetical protein [Tannerella forsythia]|uniref:Uncharacterized protein n=1 Tax=Tannerella forsythia TaxID=28112 RepID=A0A3P1XT64_TANFO|nr:hypothetical protein [Tannerella forsythia]RRD62022.1 hypothetical protein EII40_05435 [Tannerella forsythia]
MYRKNLSLVLQSKVSRDIPDADKISSFSLILPDNPLFRIMFSIVSPSRGLTNILLDKPKLRDTLFGVYH